MNLLAIAEQLKSIPDEALSPMTQGGGIAPPYLALAEMQRRASIRRSAAISNPMQRGTVKDEMKQAAMPAPQQMAAPAVSQAGGLATLGRFAGGGMIGNVFNMPWLQTQPTATPPFVPGASRPMATPPFVASTAAEIDALYPRKSITDIKREFEAMRSPSELTGLAEELAKKEEMYRSRKTKLGDILLSLGLGMAASRRPDAMGAIGEAGIGALGQWQQNKERNEAMADRVGAQRMGVLESLQRSKDVETREFGELLGRERAREHVALQAITAAQRQAAHDSNAAGLAELDRTTREKIATADRQARIDAEDAKRSFEIWKINTESLHKKEDRKSKENIQRMKSSKGNKQDPKIAAGKYMSGIAAKLTESILQNPLLIEDFGDGKKLTQDERVLKAARMARSQMAANYNPEEMALLPSLPGDNNNDLGKNNENTGGLSYLDQIKGFLKGTPPTRAVPMNTPMEGKRKFVAPDLRKNSQTSTPTTVEWNQPY